MKVLIRTFLFGVLAAYHLVAYSADSTKVFVTGHAKQLTYVCNKATTVPDMSRSYPSSSWVCQGAGLDKKNEEFCGPGDYVVQIHVHIITDWFNGDRDECYYTCAPPKTTMSCQWVQAG